MRVGPKVTDADVWDLKRTNQFSAEWQWFEKRLAEKREAASADNPPAQSVDGRPDESD